jgi:hypothetical protein
MLRQLLLSGAISLANIAIRAVVMAMGVGTARRALTWKHRRPQSWLTVEHILSRIEVGRVGRKEGQAPGRSAPRLPQSHAATHPYTVHIDKAATGEGAHDRHTPYPAAIGTVRYGATGTDDGIGVGRFDRHHCGERGDGKRRQ